MPVNTMTARADLDYAPIKALQGFTASLRCEYTADSDDPCKFIGDPIVTFVVDHIAPGWHIVSGPQSNHYMSEVPKPDCTSSQEHKGKADQVHCTGNETMALTTPAIGIGSFSFGSITLAEVQVQVDLFVSPDGSTRIAKTVDGVRIK